jgi:transcriptional regulator with XRE-family HTH domain
MIKYLIAMPIKLGEHMTFGDRLRQLRELAGLSQRELARRANIPQPVVSDVESGKQKSMSLENARRIARVMGVTLDLLAGTGEDEDATST